MDTVILGLVSGAIGVMVGYLIRIIRGNLKADNIEQKAKLSLREAKREVSAIKKDAQIEAKNEVLKARDEFESTTKSRRGELTALEERIAQKESNLDRKVSMIDKKEGAIDQKIAETEQKAADLERAKLEAERLSAEAKEKIQHVAGMTQEEARKILLGKVEEELHNEVGGLIRRSQEHAKEMAERHAQEIVAQAVQRYSGTHASEIMTSAVALPSDDMKGRIIGRDGRNIRTLEAATGVSLLIDDTPEAVVISGFDPIRREIARQSLEKLIVDGRIHPARIEEIVKKVQESMDETIRAAGEEAAYIAGVQNVNPELLRMLGRLKFRTSYTQNVLQHSAEVAHLMGAMASELNMDAALARRIGLFHDIGKALDREVEGGHAVIGADLLKREGEDQVVVNAVAAHHEEVEAESMYAVLASAADAISSSRPGARSETTQVYVKRLEKLEEIANSFNGVNKSYAIQAGREVRVVVQPDSVDDNQAMVVARSICKKIESELQYPGQIKVVVVRETRCTEYAH